MQKGTNSSSTIFVVDDNPDAREGLQALLDSVGLKCISFPSATEFLKSKLPDEASCLISDIRMPGMSGIDFQAELIKTKIQLPIIFITGHGDIPMTVKAMKAGAINFLTKPIREQDLLDSVRIALDYDRARREEEKRLFDLRMRFGTLSLRESDVMGLVCSGLMNKQTAAELGISEVTVKVHRHNLMKKLGAKSLADLVRMSDILGIHRRK